MASCLAYGLAAFIHTPAKTPTISTHLIVSHFLRRGFPVEHYKDNRPGLVVAFWGLALVLGRVLISQTDKKSDGTVFGSILNHITVGRYANGEPQRLRSWYSHGIKCICHGCRPYAVLWTVLIVHAASAHNQACLSTIHEPHGRHDAVLPLLPAPLSVVNSAFTRIECSSLHIRVDSHRQCNHTGAVSRTRLC